MHRLIDGDSVAHGISHSDGGVVELERLCVANISKRIGAAVLDFLCHDGGGLSLAHPRYTSVKLSERTMHHKDGQFHNVDC